MVKIFDQPTNNGHLMAFLGTEAAERVAADIALYYKSTSDTSSDATRAGNNSASTISQVGAVASLVGALAGLAGSRKPVNNGGNGNTVDLDLINISSYVVVPWSADTTQCCLVEAPRPLASSDKSSLRGWWDDPSFENGKSKMILSFAIGSQQVINIEATLAFVSDEWGFTKIKVDESIIENFMPVGSTELQAVTFLGKDNYPSFSLYSRLAGLSKKDPQNLQPTRIELELCNNSSRYVVVPWKVITNQRIWHLSTWLYRL
jgi:hypothetical protein